MDLLTPTETGRAGGQIEMERGRGGHIKNEQVKEVLSVSGGPERGRNLDLDSEGRGPSTICGSLANPPDSKWSSIVGWRISTTALQHCLHQLPVYSFRPKIIGKSPLNFCNVPTHYKHCKT